MFSCTWRSTRPPVVDAGETCDFNVLYDAGQDMIVESYVPGALHERGDSGAGPHDDLRPRDERRPRELLRLGRRGLRCVQHRCKVWEMDLAGHVNLAAPPPDAVHRRLRRGLQLERLYSHVIGRAVGSSRRFCIGGARYFDSCLPISLFHPMCRLIRLPDGEVSGRRF